MRLVFVFLAAVTLLCGCRPERSAAHESVGFVPAQVKLQAPGEDRWKVTRQQLVAGDKPQITVSDGKLVVRCGDKLEAAISPGLGTQGGMLEADPEDRTQLVQYSLGDAARKSERWQVEDDYQKLALPDEVLPEMLSAKKLVLDYRTNSAESRTETFALAGLKEVLAKTGCK